MSGEAARLVAELRPLVHDERVLDAIAAIPRDVFVPAEDRARAWDNRALPIAAGQTISQPLIVARMCALLELRGGERVLDVGTGSGYHAAVLAHLARPGGGVVSVERDAALARAATERLAALGTGSVEVRIADGALGAPDAAPFDAINVAAAARHAVPPALVAQLAPGGRLVAPVGRRERQRLVLVRRSRDGRSLERRELDAVRFVPLR